MKLLTSIVNYKTPDMTLKSVTAALEALESASWGWKVSVVDNDSADGSYERMRDAVKENVKSGKPGWEHVEILASGHNGGFGAGNNYAIRAALKSDNPPEYFYILNSDAFPQKNAIEKLVDYLDRHAEVGAAGSYIHGTDGQPHVTAFRFPSFLSELEVGLRLGVVTKLLKHHVVPLGILQDDEDVDWLAGASFMTRRKVLEEVGLFDEKFFLYFEETDLCRRIRKAGWSCTYVSESSVSHIGSATTGMNEWKKVPEYWFDSRRHYFLKNHGVVYLWLANLSRVLGCSLWQIRRRLQSKEDYDAPGFLPDLVRHSLKRRAR